MNSLRARIVVTLVSSIICVVVMATATLLWAREGRAEKEQRHYAQLVSEAILLIAPLFGNDEKDRISHLGLGPATGKPRPELTNLLQSQLRSAGSDLEVVVTQPTETAHPAIQPMLIIQSFYRMVNALAVARGFDPDRPPHLRKVTETI